MTTAAAAQAVQNPPRGRTRVTARSLNRVVSAVIAESLGVQAKHVDVELRDEHGSLAVSISTSVPVTALHHVRISEAHRTRPGDSLLERSERAQLTLRHRVPVLTGSEVGRISIRFTGVATTLEARVR